MNNFSYARRSLQNIKNEFKLKTTIQVENEKISLFTDEVWETRFKPGEAAIDTAIQSLMEYIGNTTYRYYKIKIY